MKSSHTWLAVHCKVECRQPCHRSESSLLDITATSQNLCQHITHNTYSLQHQLEISAWTAQTSGENGAATWQTQRTQYSCCRYICKIRKTEKRSI